MPRASSPPTLVRYYFRFEEFIERKLVNSFMPEQLPKRSLDQMRPGLKAAVQNQEFDNIESYIRYPVTDESSHGSTLILT